MSSTDVIVAGVLQAVRPRTAFGDELLRALRTEPFAPWERESPSVLLRRLVITGSVAGAVGVVGAAWLTATRRDRRKKGVA